MQHIKLGGGGNNQEIFNIFSLDPSVEEHIKLNFWHFLE